MVELANQNIFISGPFSDSLEEIVYLREKFSQIGLNAVFKLNDQGPSSSNMIENCDVFISVVGVVPGSVQTPAGDSLPELELAHAIIHRKPVIAIMKNAAKPGETPKQNRFRNRMKNTFDNKLLTFNSHHDLENVFEVLLNDGFDRYQVYLKPNKVFISYSSEDLPIVERMVKKLKMSGFHTFYAPQDIPVGSNLTKTIQRGIREVGYVIVCLSQNSIDSRWVKDELKWAIEHSNHLGLEHHEFLLPVKVADFSISDEYTFLQDVRYADLANDFEGEMNRLIGKLM